MKIPKTRLTRGIFALAFLAVMIAADPCQATYTCTGPEATCNYASDEDLKYLPSYCYIVLRTPSNDPRHVKVGKGNWKHLHHYCAALASMHRGDWKNALDQFEYCEKDNIAIHSPIVPELLMLKGQAQEKLRMSNEAVQSYRRAIAEKPDYPQAYKALAQLYLRASMVPEAKSVVEAGLRKSPNSELLKRFLTEISGKRREPAR